MYISDYHGDIFFMLIAKEFLGTLLYQERFLVETGSFQISKELEVIMFKYGKYIYKYR